MTGRPPLVLDELSLPAVARYMQSKKCKHVFVMIGAGLSTAAGIPDFRSPETGLYANLARLQLPYPEAVFDISFFRSNPIPFYTLAHELAPGRFRPTHAHSFIRLLHEKKLLHTCFTQNIDTLERRAGVPDHKLVEAHGSFASQRCIDCKAPFDDVKMKRLIREKSVPNCDRCGGLVKPDIVFFGENLPPAFHKAMFDLVTADLLLILGTSLTVHPFASLTDIVPDQCPRVLINLDPVGDIGTGVDDVVVLGKCDDVIRQLSQLLGWEEELDALWDATKHSVDPEVEAVDATPLDLEAEVQKLTNEVEKSLNLASALKGATKKIDKKQEEATGSESRETASKVDASKHTEAPTGPEEAKGLEDTDDTEDAQADEQAPAVRAEMEVNDAKEGTAGTVAKVANEGDVDDSGEAGKV